MGFSLNRALKKLDPKNVLQTVTGSDKLSLDNALKAVDPVRVTRAYDKFSTSRQEQLGIHGGNFFQKIKFSRIAADRTKITDYGPVNLPQPGLLGPDALTNSAQIEGGRKTSDKIDTYLTADDIEAQKAADAAAQAEATARQLAGSEELKRRRRLRYSSFIASGFGSASSDYKTVLGI